MRILITGPRGSGKTTLIEELSKRGYKTSQNLEEELWFEEEKSEDFEKAILKKSLAIYKKLKDEALVFFDRGVIDIIVYRKYENKPVLEDLKEYAKKCSYDKVFVLEPLNKHGPNPERDHLIKTAEDAKRWYELMLETLRDFGYIPIIIEKMSLNKRIQKVLDNI